jgi:hypothetical protein
MATTARMTFKERDLMKQMTAEVRIERGPFHPFLMRFGFWVMRCGLRIAGVGHVSIIDSRDT